MKRSKATNRPMSSINVVPYIDVMLVLLIIFMVAAPLMTQGVQVNLPKVAAKEINVKSSEPIIITIDKAGGTYLNIAGKVNKAWSKLEILTAIKARLKQSKTTSVLIKGDNDVSHGNVIEVMGWLQGVGITEIGIVTSTPDKI